MTKSRSHLLHKLVLSIVGLVLLILFTACSGTGNNTNNNSNTLVLTGTIVSASGNTVTISVQGQQYTINGLTPQEVQELQNQVGKMYTITVTKNSDGSYTISAGTQPTPGGTPGVNSTETPSNQDTTGEKISFIGPVQNGSSTTNLMVKMPDGNTVSVAVNSQTDMGDLNGQPFSNTGELLKVDAVASNNGFVATSLKIANSNDSDANVVDYTGKTTQAVGSDNVLHFADGSLNNLSFSTNANTQVKDFANVQAIPSGTLVKVEVQFNGTTGTVTKISNASND